MARQEPPADGIYRVRRGDTLSIIARRFGVSETELVRANRLRNRNRIERGPEARDPRCHAGGGGHGEVRGGACARGRDEARGPKPAKKPESAPEAAPKPAPEPPAQPPPIAIADDPEPEPTPAVVTEPEAEPELARVEEPTAELVVVDPTPEPARAPTAERSPAAPLASAPGAPPPDPSDYEVHSGKVTVQASETLGHYAEWLEVRASALRRKNGMRYEQPLVIGRSVKLDFTAQ